MGQIKGISYNGEFQEFTDQTARDAATSLSKRITNLDDAQKDNLKAEIKRAGDAELALETSKVTKETGKGLSAYDFNASYKGKLDNPSAMTGATSAADGVQGDVPKPFMGDQAKYLDGSGTWSIPHDTTYSNATTSAAGLMSNTDKKKLDNIDTEQDDISSSQTVFNTDGSITETLGNGKTKVTTFGSDSSITEKITNSAGTVITLKTTFGSDGSITRERS